MTGLAKEAPDVPRFLAVSTLGSALLAGVAAVIAAWTPRRAYATAAVIAAFIIPPIVVALVAQLSIGDLARTLVLVSPGDIVDGFNAAVYGTIPESPAVAFANLSGSAYAAAAGVGIAGSSLLVLRRYLGISG